MTLTRVGFNNSGGTKLCREIQERMERNWRRHRKLFLYTVKFTLSVYSFYMHSHVSTSTIKM